MSCSTWRPVIAMRAWRKYAASIPALADQAAALLALQASIEDEQFLEGTALDPLGIASRR
jgi:hypothetical protein